MTADVRLRRLADADRPWLVDLLTTNPWPYHSGDLDVAEVTERLDSGFYDGPDVATYVVVCGLTDVGMARVFDLDDPTPMFDLRIAQAHRGRGIGSAAVRVLVATILMSFPVDRIEGTTRRDNVAMRRAFLAAGFVKEAHHRDSWPDADGRFHDTVGYGLLRRDWESGRVTPVAWDDEPV